ncbi:MAG: hypothetical protein J4G10_07490 [Alphaproteobacteria bacterium]|nr:hypothetical protein [Alphaproteobacteria bacterium]
MKRLLAVSLVLFLTAAAPAAAKWQGVANFYGEPTPYMAEMRPGQLLSFGNPITFTYWRDAAGEPTQYKGIVQAISVEATGRMQIHIFFSQSDAKRAEGELVLEWRETRKETSSWWQFWEW